MRGIGIEEAAAIGAKHLDGKLGSDRTKRYDLTRAFKRGGFDIRAERLRYTERHKSKRHDHTNRQQDIERAACEVTPEIAQRLHRFA